MNSHQEFLQDLREVFEKHRKTVTICTCHGALSTCDLGAIYGWHPEGPEIIKAEINKVMQILGEE